MKNLLIGNSTITLNASIGLLLLRVVFGLMMVFEHGWGKLITYSDKLSGFPDPLGIGSPASLTATVFAEVVCAFLLTIGLLTRFSAFALAFTMAVAAFVVHRADPLGDKEMAILYMTVYAVIFIAGPGKYSIDEKIN